MSKTSDFVFNKDLKKERKISTHCECTVTPIAWPFSVQPIAGEGEVVKLKFLGKNTIFPEHPVYDLYFTYLLFFPHMQGR